MLFAALALSVLAMAPDIVITNTNVVDVLSGQVRRDQDVVIHDKKITYIGNLGLLHASSVPDIVDGKGKYLIPGLWDMHVHWYNEPTLGLFTANGVIGARIMFGQEKHKDWKKRIEAGSLIGPHMIVGSPIIDGPHPQWPGSWPVGKPGEGKAAIDRVKGEGWEFAKVYTWLSRKAYFEIADEAKKMGVEFEGHQPWGITPIEASNAGQRTIEHLGDYTWSMSANADAMIKTLNECPDADFPTMYLTTQRDALKTYDPKKAARINRVFVKNGTWQCPTLITLTNISTLSDPLHQQDPRLKYVPESFASEWRSGVDGRFNIIKPEGFDAAKEVVQGCKRIVGDMNREGVGILAGTDCGNPFCYPGFSLHEEMAIFVECGMTPLEALRTATINSARYMKQESQRGTVEVGKLADLALLDANPLTDIKNTTRVRAVVQGGRLFRRSDLDNLLLIAEESCRAKKG